MNLTQYRANLRTDLKDSGALWSNTELDRSVERAIDDLSRFLPLEDVVSHTIDLVVTDESITLGEDTDTDQVVVAADISASVAGSTLTIYANPDKPRVLTLAITDANASITEFTITIEGVDQNDIGCKETFYFGGGLSQTGSQVFKKVTRVVIDSITGNGSNDVCNIGVGSIYNVWHYLTYKPIEPDTIVVTSSPAGTTYVLGTDYDVDCANGSIKIISGGAMAVAGTYLVDYEKSHIGFALKSIIPHYSDVVRVLRVEYPDDNVPQTFVSFGIWDDFLMLGSPATGTSQEDMTDGDRIRFYLERKHTYPTTGYVGSVPASLDNTVCMGAGAYALFIKSLQYEHQAVTDFAAARSALLIPNTVTTGLHVLGKAALASATTQLGASVVAGLFTKVDTALDMIATTLGTLAAPIASPYLTGGTAPSVAKYLGDGDAFINTVNVGDNVPEIYAVYAQRCVDLVSGLVNIVTAYRDEASIRMSESDKWRLAGDSFVNEAAGYMAIVDRYIAEADRDIQSATYNLQLADRFRTEAVEKRNEFWSILKDKAEYRKRVVQVALRQPA